MPYNSEQARLVFFQEFPIQDLFQFFFFFYFSRWYIAIALCVLFVTSGVIYLHRTIKQWDALGCFYTLLLLLNCFFFFCCCRNIVYKLSRILQQSAVPVFAYMFCFTDHTNNVLTRGMWTRSAQYFDQKISDHPVYIYEEDVSFETRLIQKIKIWRIEKKTKNKAIRRACNVNRYFTMP